ncbi:hypothetical protein [Paenibacillus silvae]|uniref:Uncharacterized protein n=1 Tax=Paenibacillus silvae TaxID=1325358 RepID=A0A2W6PGQ6_9BACL|nr:hypothetical protein [Paenibacillus silvae]PZT57336.1 hypothetical protein DN757_01380 [Paenibacillus silvae]
MSEIKYVDIKEFREKGYLFELNRKFLHPLGMALEVKIDDNGKEILGGVWDYREDPEGMLYDDKTMKSKKSAEKAAHIEREFDQKATHRAKEYGFVIQPLLNSL